MKVLFVEPPKEFWFVMGEYLPPPFSLLQLAAYIEHFNRDVEINVLDCQAQGIDWRKMEERIASFDPDLVAASSLATCNAYTTVRALESAKRVKPEALTVTGGQHFTALAEESLRTYPCIDFIVRGEGEATLSELVARLATGGDLAGVTGLSYRVGDEIRHNPARELIESLDTLPFPGYHFVEKDLGRYHFSMMAGRDTKYMIVEGSRGCQYDCTFCSQWCFWGRRWRAKSAGRIAEEMERCSREFGATFFWLTDDNFNLARGEELSREIGRRGLSGKIMWFAQARCDDIAAHADAVSEMQKAGCYWMLLGVESGEASVLREIRKGEDEGHARDAFRILKDNGVFGQGTFIIGHRRDTAKSIAMLRDYTAELDPDLAIFMILTPFPGTFLYEEAEREGWIEDRNWANYDMVHAVMPTETLSRAELQEELYRCYRGFYGSWPRRLRGIFSANALKRRTYRYLASQNLLNEMRNLF